jgi:prolyl-tRNA synthetase
MQTIEALAEFMKVSKSKTAKAVFMTATFKDGDQESQKLVFAVVRGDMDVNETKLANVIKSVDLRPAQEEEIRAVGAVAGYASPIGLKGVLVVVDDLVPESANLVAGANEDGFHYTGVNYGRDYTADIVADIVVAEDGRQCPNCGSALRTSRGVEVGNIFKLGTRYTSALGANYLDVNGKQQPIVMGSYGIGSGRMLACAAEEHHDEKGLMLPITIAPFEVHLLSLRGGEEGAKQLYADLQMAGLDVLFDDRDETPGVKFNDADLIGLPIRLTISERSLKEGGVELKLRSEADRRIVPQAEVVQEVVRLAGELLAAINAKVVEIPFDSR